ncbi:MAG: hypothetical protein ACPGJS_16315 [Flammeovirgaceae bacterium]
MAKYLIIIIAFILPIAVNADPDDLIDFDDPANERYLKSHTIISAELDKDFNFRKDSKPPTVYCLNDVISNFSPDKVNKFFLKIKYENWIHDWMKNNQNLRLFFNIDHNTGIPKLMGYSRKRLNINERSEASVSGLINLKDFTHVDASTLQEGEYIVGTLSPDFNKVYPYVFKSAIALSYPSDLKWRNIDSYIGTYQLNKPLSVGQIHSVLSNKASQIVLKKIGNTNKYEICGYIKPMHLDMPME